MFRRERSGSINKNHSQIIASIDRLTSQVTPVRLEAPELPYSDDTGIDYSTSTEMKRVEATTNKVTPAVIEKYSPEFEEVLKDLRNLQMELNQVGMGADKGDLGRKK